MWCCETERRFVPFWLFLDESLLVGQWAVPGAYRRRKFGPPSENRKLEIVRRNP